MCVTALRVVIDASATSRMPSTSGASTSASATGRIGDVSMITKSETSRRSATSSPMASDCNSSVGRAGTGPLTITRRFSTCGACSESHTVVSPVNAFDRPGSPSRAKKRCALGLRRSAEISTTRLPESASTTARLAAVVDLPSPALALATMIVCRPRCMAEKRMLVRSVR